jgi:predicted alpha/beta-fold hydrolase
MYGEIREGYGISDLSWEHVEISCPDGGKACLLISQPEVKTSRVLVIFPSLTSLPHNFGPLIRAALSQGMIVVCLNKRGHHCPLETQTFHLLGEAEEISLLMQEVHRRFGAHRCFGFGLSAGSIMLLNYLGKNPKQTVLEGAFCLCGGYDPGMIENVSAAVSRTLKRNLKDHILFPTNWKDMFHAMEDTAMNLRQVALLFAGESDEAKFLSSHELLRKLRKISIPLVLMNARDDCVFEWSDRYLGVLHDIPQALVVVTNTGGHGAYVTSMNPRNQLSWAEEIALKFYEGFSETLTLKCV